MLQDKKEEEGGGGDELCSDGAFAGGEGRSTSLARPKARKGKEKRIVEKRIDRRFRSRQYREKKKRKKTSSTATSIRCKTRVNQERIGLAVLPIRSYKKARRCTTLSP